MDYANEEIKARMEAGEEPFNLESMTWREEFDEKFEDFYDMEEEGEHYQNIKSFIQLQLDNQAREMIEVLSVVSDHETQVVYKFLKSKYLNKENT